MKKKIINEEIDLLELILVMWEQKWKVILITIISLSILLISEVFLKKEEQVKYEIQTKINSISTFEGSKYSSYNNYIEQINSRDIVYYVANENYEEELITNNNINLKEVSDYNINYSGFKKITKLYLLKLFVEKINDPSFELSQIIEEFDPSQNNDDKNIEPIKKIPYSIKVKKNTDEEINFNVPSYNLILATNDLKTGKKLIFFLNEHINREIRNYLLEEFENQVLDVLKFKEYKIEDIDFEISGNLDDKNKVHQLKKIRKTIVNNKKLERLNNIFRDTPIVKEKEFVASNMMIGESQIKIVNDKNDNIIFKIIFTILMSLLLSTIYVLIINSIKMRK